MKATKRPIRIEYFPCELKYLKAIMKWSNSLRPIKYIIRDGGLMLSIQTLEGIHSATSKDVIIKGINGEVYPCKKDIFEKTYKLTEDTLMTEEEYFGLDKLAKKVLTDPELDKIIRDKLNKL